MLGSTVGVLGFGRVGWATDYTWTGAANADWATGSANWATGGGSSVGWPTGNTNNANFVGASGTGTTITVTSSTITVANIFFEPGTANYTFNSSSKQLIGVNSGQVDLEAGAGTGVVETFNTEFYISTATHSSGFIFADNDADSASHLVFGNVTTNNAVPNYDTILQLSGSGTGTNLINGVISDNVSQPVSVAANETAGSWQLSGASTYSGPTVVNSQSPSISSVLILNGSTNTNVLGATPISVGSNATGGTGTLITGSGTLRTIGNVSLGTSTAGSLTVTGGDGVSSGQGTLDMTDAGANTTTHTLTLNNATPGATVMTIGSATAPAVLDFGVSASNTDKIVMSGTLSIAAGGGIVNLNVLGTPTGTSPYTLISAGGITGAGSLVFSNLTNTYTTGGETYTLFESGNSEELGFAPATSSPEPTSVGIVVFGAGIATLKRRRISIQQTTSRTV